MEVESGGLGQPSSFRCSTSGSVAFVLVQISPCRTVRLYVRVWVFLWFLNRFESCWLLVERWYCRSFPVPCGATVCVFVDLLYFLSPATIWWQVGYILCLINLWRLLGYHRPELVELVFRDGSQNLCSFQAANVDKKELVSRIRACALSVWSLILDFWYQRQMTHNCIIFVSSSAQA